MIAAFLLLAGCASASGPQRLSTRVNEVMGVGQQRMGVAGTHFIRVRIHNVSAEPVVIHSVRVDASGPDVDSEPDTETFDQTIMPDETLPFDLVVTVSSRTRTAVNQQLNSVSVTIAYVAGQQDMTDSGNYSLGREMSGG